MIIELRRTKSKFYYYFCYVLCFVSLFSFYFSSLCISARLAFFLLSLSLSLCFWLLVSFFVYDQFNDLFVVLCVFGVVSVSSTTTRDYVMFVVYLVVGSTVFFFIIFLLYSVSQYYGIWGIRYALVLRGMFQSFRQTKFDMRHNIFTLVLHELCLWNANGISSHCK